MQINSAIISLCKDFNFNSKSVRLMTSSQNLFKSLQYPFNTQDNLINLPEYQFQEIDKLQTKNQILMLFYQFHSFIIYSR